MATSPAYAAVPNAGTPGLLTTADASLTAPAATATVFTAGANGSRVESLDVVGVATTVAGIVNVFLHNGSVAHLLKQIPIAAVMVSTTAPAPECRMNTATNPELFPIILPTGWSVRVATTVAQTGIKVHARGGDF